jgi:hypothetical protein
MQLRDSDLQCLCRRVRGHAIGAPNDRKIGQYVVQQVRETKRANKKLTI